MSKAKVKNPRKKFLWSLEIVGKPISPFLFQKIQVPEVTVEQVAHGDINRDVKTAGRVSVGNLSAEKLETTSGSDTFMWDWLSTAQDMLLGGGGIPVDYWEQVIITELAEDGRSVLNKWILDEVWPTKLNGQELDRMSSENTIESLEFSVGTVEKL